VQLGEGGAGQDTASAGTTQTPLSLVHGLTRALYSPNGAFDEFVRRRYRLAKRAESAAATRRRIVEATLGLHDEQGITGTSVRDVASAAGVAPATVLHHFPRMDDLIQACGELSNAMAPMPTEASLASAVDRSGRIRLMVAALFAWWEELGPGMDHLEVDRRTLPRVDAWLRDVAVRHRRLVAVALGAASEADLALATAMTSRGAWCSMRESGVATGEAAAAVARLIIDGIGLAEPSSTGHRERLH
jgi:AcrR family transcriptional regulator